MRFLVTGSAGHLGEGLMRTLRAQRREAVGLDRLESPFTERVGDLRDFDFVRRSVKRCDVILHVATLHKPHLATHSRRDFVETNVVGTLNVLEAALAAGVSAVVFTSTTSAFGASSQPRDGEPAVWVDESLPSRAKNIYGVSKNAAEELGELFSRTRGLPLLVLRTARFFMEEDDDAVLRSRYPDRNLKANEYLYRRLDLADAVDAHLLAAEAAPGLGFARYLVSATTPFEPEHLRALRSDAPAVVRDLFPEHVAEYERRGWSMLPAIDRVYVNHRAREELGWRPRFDFSRVLERLRRDEDFYSPLARAVGSKGYHDRSFAEGPYPVEPEGKAVEPEGQAVEAEPGAVEEDR